MKRRATTVKTKVFEIAERQGLTLTALADAMDLSVAAVSRVRKGKRQVSGIFIAAALRAFPRHAYGELFYSAEEEVAS